MAELSAASVRFRRQSPNFAVQAVQLLTEQGQTVATAESLTGGLLGAAITSVSGSSAVYRGGLVVYATDLKATLARVRTETLERHGAVSKQAAVEMAVGCAEVCGADWGLATTGVAGPDRQEGHPPGTVFLAVASFATKGGQPVGGNILTQQLDLKGDRAAVRNQTVFAAVELLVAVLEDD